MQTGRHFLSSCSEVNSTGYPEFDEPISARHQRYPLFKYILISIIGSINFVIVFILSPVTLFIFVFLNFCNSYNRPLLKMHVVAETSSNFFLYLTMRCLWIMLATAVCFLFLIKLKWPKNKNSYDFSHFIRF